MSVQPPLTIISHQGKKKKMHHSGVLWVLVFNVLQVAILKVSSV